MHTLLSVLGTFISTLAICWSVYAFVLNRRDQRATAERRQFYNDMYDHDDIVEKQIKGVIDRLNGLTDEITDLKKEQAKLVTQMALENQAHDHLRGTFKDYVHQVGKVIEKHEAELKELGRVIVKG